MQEVLIDIKELTDSREMYQSKPHPFVWIFTYILFALIAAALVWACFGKKEIVVKANGQVRPESGISTVKNIVSGEVESVSYEQGIKVKTGDILYVIKHDNLLVEKDAQNSKLSELQEELSNLTIFRRSIESGTNEFDLKEEPMYYEKVRKLLMDIQYSQTDTNFRVTKLDEERNINREQLSKYQEEIACLNKYIKALDDEKNYFINKGEIEKQYMQKYDNYLISKREIDRRYEQQSNEIKSSSYEALKQTLEEEKALLSAYKTLKRSVNQAKNLFAESDINKSLYNDYDYKTNMLKNTYEEQKRVYEAHLALSGIAVSKSELESAKLQMQKAEGEYSSFKSNFISDVEKNINEKEIRVSELESRLSGTMDKASLLKLNEVDRENSIKRLYLDERTAASDAIEKLTDTINSLKLNITLAAAELKTITDAAGDENNLNYSLVERTKVQEIVSTDEKIKAVKENIQTVEQNIKKLQLDIDNAVVRANMDGVINILAELYSGDFIASGNNVLTIIPDKDSAFTMQIMISNKDIGEINTGDTVKYSFAALPYREYGQVTGKITSISKDAITNETNGQSFYAVEATVPGGKLVSNSGKQGEIKVGMLCESNIITKSKSFLRYFLEKIDLLD